MKTPGVITADVSLTTNTANVEFTSSETLRSAQVLVLLIEDLGFGAEILDETSNPIHDLRNNHNQPSAK